MRSRGGSASSSTASVRVKWTGNPPSRCGRRTGTRRTSASSNCERRSRTAQSPASLGSSIATNPSRRTMSGWYGKGCRIWTGTLRRKSRSESTGKESLGDLQRAMRGLFSDPDLLLQDFGGIQGGSFRFSKGNVADFHYKNLSGGEKAAFDVILDVFVKRDEATEAVFCIDEPELHVATALQGTADCVNTRTAAGAVAVVGRDAFDRNRQGSLPDATRATQGGCVSGLFRQRLRWSGHHDAQHSRQGVLGEHVRGRP